MKTTFCISGIVGAIPVTTPAVGSTAGAAGLIAWPGGELGLSAFFDSTTIGGREVLGGFGHAVSIRAPTGDATVMSIAASARITATCLSLFNSGGSVSSVRSYDITLWAGTSQIKFDSTNEPMAVNADDGATPHYITRAAKATGDWNPVGGAAAVVDLEPGTMNGLWFVVRFDPSAALVAGCQHIAVGTVTIEIDAPFGVVLADVCPGGGASDGFLTPGGSFLYAPPITATEVAGAISSLIP